LNVTGKRHRSDDSKANLTTKLVEFPCLNFKEVVSVRILICDSIDYSAATRECDFLQLIERMVHRAGLEPATF
jgi:hypothetical protein